MLTKLIRWVLVTKAAPAEPQQFAVQQITYQGKVADSAVVFPYGIHANLPVDSLGLMFAVGDTTEDRAVIGYNPKVRPTLLEGEVSFYHPPTGSFITWKESGDLDILVGEEGGGNVTITCTDANVTASGDVNVTASGDVDVTATNVNIDATTTNLGVGGAAIARVGDPVSVDSGTHAGTITAGGLNTSI